MEKPVVGEELGLVTPPISTTNCSLPGSALVRNEDRTNVLSAMEQVGLGMNSAG